MSLMHMYHSRIPLRLVKGKPYVTVSAKGVSNGLSDIYNDGDDFGPDTMLGATAPDQYGPPYTQTSGIQEAINYAMNNGYSRIFLRRGQYIISAPPTPDPNSPGHYAQIHIPAPPISNWGEIFMEGEVGAPFGYSYAGDGTTNDLVYSGPTPNTGVQLLSTLTLSDISTTGVTSVLYADIGTYAVARTTFSALTWHCENIRVTVPPGLTITAFNAYNIERVVFRNCVADVNMTQSDYPPNPANAQGNTAGIEYDFVGYSIPQKLMNGGTLEEIYVVGYYTGITGKISHVWMNRIYIQSCYFGIRWIDYDGHINLIGYVNIQQTPYHFVNRSGGNIYLIVMALDTEENFNLPSTNPYYWTNQQYNFYNTSGGSISGIVFYHRQGLNLPNTNLLTNNPSNVILRGIYIDSPDSLSAVYPSKTTVNGPTAGTVTVDAVHYATNYMKYIITFSGYENNTTTNQTINFPIPFSSYAVITANNIGLTISASTSGITVTSPNSTTTYSGIVIVEGY
jgi:hypothetical protein